MIERECPVCGKVYLANPFKLKRRRNLTCSIECSYIQRGRDASTKITLTCVRCGKTFERNPYAVQRGGGQYCSPECHNPPIIKTCPHCGIQFRVSPSADHQVFCSPQCVKASGVKSEKSRRAVNAMWSDPIKKAERIQAIKRRSATSEWRSAPHFQRGNKHPKYKGNRDARPDGSRYEYKKWRTEVFQRDNYTCQDCGVRGQRLNAHHIKAWAEYPELRFDISNGIALCEDCHNKRHGKQYKPKTYACVTCGKRKTDGRRLHCRSCGAKTRKQ